MATPQPDIKPISNYNEITLQRIITQYKESPRLNAVAGAPDGGFDKLEQAFQEIRDLFYLDSATGIQLDIIGKIFHLLRNGLSDAGYRAKLKLTAAKRFSGTPNEIINTLKVFFGATFVKYQLVPPAGFTIQTDVPISDDELLALSPAGVGIGEVVYLVDVDDGFQIITANGDEITAVKEGA